MLVVRLCNYLTANGIENFILTTSMQKDVERDLSSTRVIIAPNMDGTAFGEIKALCCGVRKHGSAYDVINPHNYPAELTTFFTGTPSVWMCNEPELYLNLRYGTFNWKYKAFLKALFIFQKYVVKRKMKAAVVSDDFNAARFSSIYGVVPDIINYGIDADYFSKCDGVSSRKTLGVDDEFVLLQVGMMTPLKNQMESLLVLNSLKFRIKRLKLVLAGLWQEDYKKELDCFIDENDLNERVVFTGHISREKLRNWYHAADVLIHPVKAQGGWLSPFEAVSAGLPVVVSKEMTASDLVESERLGEVSDKYGEVITEIIANREKYLEKTRRAAVWVRDNLSWDGFGKKYLDILERTIENNAKIRDRRKAIV